MSALRPGYFQGVLRYSPITTGVAFLPLMLCGALIRGGTSLHHEAGQPEPLDGIVSALI
ncbi:hypothetical protein EDD90_9508 [Streptomyces sp. Ag109_O5-1]|uniref:hypothetical protein n=1 Tax=Streptomyces sp. Ag109_O5-1 TaxID=1938851 RepID=UPI000FA53483|nr:hypothetical protein [Streptomyces sp. Ag109_O5-1]RPE46178.1 hypothetical protein EDD90_9508 [Streptomyces sp. Ag109_O5-1]